MSFQDTIGGVLKSTLFTLQKHSPVILTGVGVAGVITSGVLAARATLKLEDTLDKANDRLTHAESTDQSKAKAIAVNGLDLVKLYGPSVSLGVVSLVCIISAHGILTKRNATIGLAYKGLEETYNRYRARVREEYGDEIDNDFHRGIRNEEITDENGKKHKVKVLSADKNGHFGPTTSIFGPGNPNWQGTHEFNEFYLNQQQNYLNDLLDVQGFVTLNDAYGRVGLPKTSQGAITGWIKGKGVYVDFGKQLLDSPHARDLEYPDRGSWLLDFNVQGLIWDQIDQNAIA